MDYPHRGFDCINYLDKQDYRTFEEGKDLKCASPEDTETFLKACEAHTLIPVTQCSFSLQDQDFLCKDPQGHFYFIAAVDADNYACLSKQDLTRLEERCK